MSDLPPWEGAGAETLAVLRTLLEHLEAGTPCALCTVEWVEGSTPRGAGARLVVPLDGRPAGTVGGGVMESRVIERARECLGRRTGEVVDLVLDEASAGGLPSRCGGRARVRIEWLDGPGRVVVFGAGHVGAATARVARAAGLPVRVVDDRPELLAPLAAEGIPVVHAAPEAAAAAASLRPADAAVVVTPGHAHDERIVKDCLAAPDLPGYLGMIGSRRKVALTRQALRDAGIEPHRLEALRAPVGLDLGAETPGEIAVAIVAEIVLARRGPRGMGRPAPGTPERPAGGNADRSEP